MNTKSLLCTHQQLHDVFGSSFSETQAVDERRLYIVVAGVGEGGEQCHGCGNFSASWSDGFSRATIPCTDELSGSGAKCQRAGAARGPCWGPGPLHLATFPRIFSVLARYNFHMTGAALSCHCLTSSQGCS